MLVSVMNSSGQGREEDCPASERAPLADAATVAIVVHGVGDQTALDVLAEVKAGFKTVASAGAEVSEISLPEFPQLDGRKGTQEALRIREGDRIHVVIPVIWSHLRWRTTKAFHPYDQRRYPFLLDASVLSPLFGVCSDSLRLIPKAQSLLWRFALALVALLVIVLILGFAAGTLYLRVHLTFRLGVVAASSPQFNWYDPLLLLGFFFILGSIAKRCLPMFDFIGDVAAYVGKPERRMDIEGALRATIDAAAKSAPAAQILVVGHSLGTVVVSHSLLGLKQDHPGSGRLILVTLGSPLRRMSRIFPAYVKSPEELLSAYAGQRTVIFWANLWRDRDFIGRALKPTVQEIFAEKSLGDGPHWGMWSDRRLWQSVHSLLETAANKVFATLKRAWVDDTLSRSEERR